MACSHSPEALTSLASFTESLSLALGFLARAHRLSAQLLPGADGSFGSGSKRRQSQGGRRSSRGARRRSSIGGRRRSLAGRDGSAGGSTWSVAVDLRKVDALLTMLKQLDDQESAGHLMNAGNHVSFDASNDVGGGAYCPVVQYRSPRWRVINLRYLNSGSPEFESR